MKKIICVFICLFMLLSMNTFANAESTEIEQSKQYDLHENPAVSQHDLDFDFADYANDEATISLDIPYSDKDMTAYSNVVGIVLDKETGAPIPGAEVSIGDYSVSCDVRGRFHFVNVPNGKLSFTISANGYKNANYYNYPVSWYDGANIFTFYLSDAPSTTDRAVIEQLCHERSEHSCPEPFRAPSASYSMNAKPNVSSVVSVQHGGSVQSISRRQYIYTVLSVELYSSQWYIENGMRQAAVNQLFVAQAVAANTYLEYAQSVYSQHASSDSVCQG